VSRPPEEELQAARKALAEAAALLENERTARVRAERANALKDEFLSLVAHELRSPLGAILGWAHMLRQRRGQEEFDKGLDVIEQSVRVQARLIADLLDLSRMVSGKIRLDLESVEPRSFIDAAVEAVAPDAQAKEIGIRKVLDLTVGLVSGDAARLQQVMVNLLSNAVKYTPEKGSIEVTLRQAGGHAEVSVADSGIGIAAAFLPEVFDRFRQTDLSIARRHGGLGLGLAIVRHLVELHGGQVVAESPGERRGATFTVRLPLADRQESEAA
jgi:signal transduction histidine kinase